jgi:hypothetical protein
LLKRYAGEATTFASLTNFGLRPRLRRMQHRGSVLIAFAFFASACSGGDGKGGDIAGADAALASGDVHLEVTSIDYAYSEFEDERASMVISVDIKNHAEGQIALAHASFQIEDGSGLLERAELSATCNGQELASGGEHACDLSFPVSVDDHYVALHFNYGAPVASGSVGLNETVPEKPADPICEGKLTLTTEICQNCFTANLGACMDEAQAVDVDCFMFDCGGCATPDAPGCSCADGCSPTCGPQMQALGDCLEPICPECVL